MALTQTTLLSMGAGTPIPSVGTDRQTAAAPVPSPNTQLAPEAAAAAASARNAAQPPPAQQVSASSGVGFTLRFDPDTQRMILEARDAATGFVIDQMPPKYVVKQFSAQVSQRAGSARGTRIDNAS
jgi:hypothetical protein